MKRWEILEIDTMTNKTVMEMMTNEVPILAVMKRIVTMEDSLMKRVLKGKRKSLANRYT